MEIVFPQTTGCGAVCRADQPVIDWVTTYSALVGRELGEISGPSPISVRKVSPEHKQLSWGNASQAVGAITSPPADANILGFPRQTTGVDLVVKTVPVPDTGDSVVSDGFGLREPSPLQRRPGSPTYRHPPYERRNART